MGYAGVAGVVEWIALTDGNEYRIYNAHAQVPIQQKLFKRVVLVSDDPDNPATLLLQVIGFCEVVEQAGVTVIRGEPDNADADQCYAIAGRVLESEPLQGLFGPYAYHPNTFARLIVNHRLKPAPIVIGFDMIPPTIDAIRAGLVRSSIWIREYYFGLHACAALGLMLRLGIPQGLELLGQSSTAHGGNRLLLTPETFDASTVDDFVAWQSAVSLPSQPSRPIS